MSDARCFRANDALPATCARRRASGAAGSAGLAILALFRRLLLALALILVAASPALAEIGCIADVSVHASVEATQVLAEGQAEGPDGIATGQPHREPAGHSAACHLSHNSHCQLPGVERTLKFAAGERSPARYWTATADIIAGHEPDGANRPPRA